MARRRSLRGWAAGGAAGIVAVSVAFVVLSGGVLSGGAPTAAGSSAPAAADPVTGELVKADTFAVVNGAPIDAAVDAASDGLVVHPVRETPVLDAPNGRAIASMPISQFGDTWLPVIDQQPGFVHVLLPAKPNGSSGWLRTDDLESARTPYLIKVHLTSMKLELLKNGKVTDSWKAGIGKASAPTPTGRTFLLGAFSDPKQAYSPVILPLGTHSPTLDTFGGGPGTVAIHTWPSDEVFGTASSDGCIRIPGDALKKLTSVPLGTLVSITND